MKTLIIYDNNGMIISQITGNGYKFPSGVPYLEVEIQEGKYAKSVNVETKEVIYENIPLSEIEILENKISILEAENNTQNEDILSSLLASSELFEMILSIVPMEINKKTNITSNMTHVYISLIKKGLKTIDNVPDIIREEVRNNIK